MTTITTNTAPAARWTSPFTLGVAAFGLATGLSALLVNVVATVVG